MPKPGTRQSWTRMVYVQTKNAGVLGCHNSVHLSAHFFGCSFLHTDAEICELRSEVSAARPLKEARSCNIQCYDMERLYKLRGPKHLRS